MPPRVPASGLEACGGQKVKTDLKSVITAKMWQKNMSVNKISYNVIWDYFVLLPSLVKVVARVTLTVIHNALLIYKSWLVFPHFHLISS